MKKLIYVLLAVIFIASCTPEKKETHFSMKVGVDTVVGGYAYLQKRADGEWIKLDSAMMIDGAFNMQGEITTLL